MMSVKRKLNIKYLNEKCKALRGLESGLSNKEVGAKYGVPKNTVSTWVKNRAKLFTALEQCSNKRKKLRESDYKRVDDVVFKWFSSKKSQDIRGYTPYVIGRTFRGCGQPQNSFILQGFIFANQ